MRNRERDEFPDFYADCDRAGTLFLVPGERPMPPVTVRVARRARPGQLWDQRELLDGGLVLAPRARGSGCFYRGATGVFGDLIFAAASICGHRRASRR